MARAIPKIPLLPRIIPPPPAYSVHPSMKSIIVREIPRWSSVLPLHLLHPPLRAHIFVRRRCIFLFCRPKSKTLEAKKQNKCHARYYATITYNQIVLAPGDREVALQLINVSLRCFKELLGEGNSGDGLEEANDDVKSEKEWGTKKGKAKDRKGHVRTKGKMKAKEIKGEADLQR